MTREHVGELNIAEGVTAWCLGEGEGEEEG